MIDKIVMFTCDYCHEVDYFPTNNVQMAKKCASNKQRSSSPWVFKHNKEFCCKECCEKWVEENTWKE